MAWHGRGVENAAGASSRGGSVRHGGSLDRRELVLGAAAASLIGVLIGPAAAAGGDGWPKDLVPKEKTPAFDDALKAVLGEGKPIAGKLTLDITEIAENGNTVPFTVAVESAMSGDDFVKAIHVLSTANPVASVVTFRFSALSGKAMATSRMRLAKSQDVVAIAEMSDGRFLMTLRNVKVTIGGCGG